MMSLFDDAEFIIPRRRLKQPFLEGSFPDSIKISSLQAKAFPEYRKSSRRRTVVEALERIYSAHPPDFDAVHLYGFSRLTRKAFILYNASRLVAAGLVVLDPLDRLEGGLN
jgi:hypothetical protein